MKSIYKKILANIRPICQIIVLIFILLLPSFLDITNKVQETPKLSASQDLKDYIFYILWNGGNVAIGIFFFGVTLFVVRKWNKDYIFNKGNEYKNYPYFWYWMCSKILGYTKCNLILVPIYMQFKLVIRDTFDKYYCGELGEKSNDAISVQKINFEDISNEVNIIIADTYPLKMNQLPREKRLKSTIIISRNNAVDHNRYDSPELVWNVTNEVRNLPTHVKNINIYATTNAYNTMKIAQNVFKLGGRSNLNLVTVFQQKRTGNRKFGQRGRIIYRR